MELGKFALILKVKMTEWILEIMVAREREVQVMRETETYNTAQPKLLPGL